MTNEEVPELILDVLTFCNFQEVPHFVNEEGAFVYREDISYGISRISYKYIGTSVQICDPTGEWYELRPLNSLDHCGWIITRISHILDYKFRHTDKGAELRLYDELQTDIKQGLLPLMGSLNTEYILTGIQTFIKKAQIRIDKLTDNQ